MARAKVVPLPVIMPIAGTCEPHDCRCWLIRSRCYELARAKVVPLPVITPITDLANPTTTATMLSSAYWGNQPQAAPPRCTGISSPLMKYPFLNLKLNENTGMEVLEAAPSRVALGDDHAVLAGRNEALDPAIQARRRDHDRHYPSWVLSQRTSCHCPPPLPVRSRPRAPHFL